MLSEAWLNLNWKNLGVGVWFSSWQICHGLCGKNSAWDNKSYLNCLFLSPGRSVFTKEKNSKSFYNQYWNVFKLQFLRVKKNHYNISNYEVLQRNNQFWPPDSKLCAGPMTCPKLLFSSDLEIKSIVVYPTHVNDNYWTDGSADSLFSDLLWGEPGNITLLFIYLFYIKNKHTFPRQSKIYFIYFENIQITYIFASKQISLVAEIAAEINEFSVANLQSDHLKLWMSTPGNRI